MITNTLTSLAIMQVDVDHRRTDYLDYLIPFISQIIIDHDSNKVSNDEVTRNIKNIFGLEIPERTVEIVLKRMAKRKLVAKDDGQFVPTDKLSDPNIASRKAAIERHIHAVIYGLQRFSEDTHAVINTDEQAITAICTFLAEFDITCLRAHLRGTVIPDLQEAQRPSDIVLVSDYIKHLQKSAPERFDSFIIMVRGHMLANALTCPDLKDAPQSYRGVCFYFDTPLLIHRLGLEGVPKQRAVQELIILLKRLGAKVATFSHSLKELQSILQASAGQIDSNRSENFNQIVQEARRTNTTKSDLIYLSETVHEELCDAEIEIIETPDYDINYQIDEENLGRIMENNYFYRNPKAKVYDINSVRSIYALRRSRHILTIEKSVATLITNNAAFAKAAWEYGKTNENNANVSSIITDFSLANTAWLKAPMNAPSLPKVQLLAFAYAALEPPQGLWEKYMKQIDKLELSGRFSERRHQLLRSSPLIISELMHFTLGEESAFTEETVTQIYERISEDIKKEAYEELVVEQTKHQETRQELKIQKIGSDEQRQQKDDLLTNIYRKHANRAKILFGVVSVIIAAILITCLTGGLMLSFGSELSFWIKTIISLVPAALTLANFWCGTTIKGLCSRGERWYLNYRLRQEEKSLNLETGELSDKIKSTVHHTHSETTPGH